MSDQIIGAYALSKRGERTKKKYEYYY